MRLGDDIVEVTVGDNVDNHRLRPFLRAACLLEKRHGGFDKIIRAVADGDWRIISDVIVECSEPRLTHAGIVRAIAGIPLKRVIPPLIEPVLSCVFAMAGVDPDNPKQDWEGERITFQQYHAKLYRLGTGWLGWTPQETWAATPAEIEEAFTGRMEFCRAIFGGADDKPDHVPDKPDQAKLDRAGLAKLKAMSGKRKVG
jgi:hypothetical protein